MNDPARARGGFVMKPYRPSNGTEGMDFMESWCANCQHDEREDKPCQILGRTLAFQIDDPRYPTEWIETESGPKCTAYKEIGKDYGPEPTERCKKTQDLFNSETTNSPRVGGDGENPQ